MRRHGRYREAGSRAVVCSDDDGERDEDGDGEPATDGADVVEPLAGLDSADIESNDYEEPEDREGHVVRGAGGKRATVTAEGNEDGAGAKVEDGREVWQVGHPVGPGGEEGSAVTEGFTGPDVEAAFVGIAGGEGDDAGSERHEQPEEGEDPDQEGARTGGCGRGDPAHAEYGDDVEEGEVAKAE